MLRSLPPALFSLFVLCGLAAAAGPKTHSLEAGPGTVRAVRALDLTGDGLADLVAFTDGPEGIALPIWIAGEHGAFREKPDLVVKPAALGLEEVYYACPATLHRGEPGTILVVDRAKGVVNLTLVFAEREGEKVWALHGPEKVADAPPLPFLPDERRVVVLDVTADLDGDGEEELVLPSEEGHRVIRPGAKDGEGGRSPVRVVGTGTTHRLSAGAHRFLTLHWEIPRVTVADWDGDGLGDLIASRGNRFLLYLQRKDGSFLEEPRRLDLLVAKPGEKERSEISLADVNGDGRVDLLVTQTATSVQVMGDFSSQHSLFLNPRVFSLRTPGRLGTPADTFRTAGTSFHPTLFDFDGDGDLDLLVSSLRIDLGSQIRRNVSAEYSLFLFDAEGEKPGFESSSLFDVSRPFPWDRLKQRSTAPVCFFEGDFDGDGNRDLVDIADDGHLTILYGDRNGGLFSASYSFGERDGQPFFRARATVESDLILRDLNRDGLTDLVAHQGDRVLVIRSEK